MKKVRTKKLIVGNWKLNPDNLLEAKDIFLGIRKVARELPRVKTVICPPAPFIHELSKLFHRSKMALGAQNAFYEDSGAYTGEISSALIKNSGATYVILGHSERRALGESNEVVNKKVLKALKTGLLPIVCVGEKERDEHGNYMEFVTAQIRESLAKISDKDIEKVIVAYEPVWAIGKSDKEAMQPTQIYEMTIFIRKILSDIISPDAAHKIYILYGGSVSSRIAEPILKEGQVDGLLVGRSSLTPEDFNGILRLGNSIKLINQYQIITAKNGIQNNQ